jgi:hypothetical protein
MQHPMTAVELSELQAGRLLQWAGWWLQQAVLWRCQAHCHTKQPLSAPFSQNARPLCARRLTLLLARARQAQTLVVVLTAKQRCKSMATKSISQQFTTQFKTCLIPILVSRAKVFCPFLQQLDNYRMTHSSSDTTRESPAQALDLHPWAHLLVFV